MALEGPPRSSNSWAQLPSLVLHLLQLGWYVLHKVQWGLSSSCAPGVGLGSLGGRGTQSILVLRVALQPIPPTVCYPSAEPLSSFHGLKPSTSPPFQQKKTS